MGFVLVEVRQPRRKPLVVAVRDTLEVGRECDGLLLTDPEVSRRHIALDVRQGELTVKDLGSTNGTTVNGAKIDGVTAVTSADVIRFGGTEVQLLQQAEGVEAAPSHETVTPGSPRGTIITGTADDALVRGKADATAARATSIDAVAAAAADEVPDVKKLAGDGGTITIVFSDIESSTEMALQLGDAKWVALLGVHNKIIRRHLQKARGTEVKHQGDGFMLTFPSARAAVKAMIEIQQELAVYSAEHPETPIRIRIGAHTGEAIADEGGDLFGKHIIVASRIANAADGGQILVSSITKEIASSRGDLKFGPPQTVELKGIDDAYTVCEVLWNDFGNNAKDTAPQGTEG